MKLSCVESLLTASCLIILAGDVSKNPSPVSDPCAICSKGCRRNQKAIQCDNCDLWFHALKMYKNDPIVNTPTSVLGRRLFGGVWSVMDELSGQVLETTNDLQSDMDIDICAVDRAVV